MHTYIYIYIYIYITEHSSQSCDIVREKSCTRPSHSVGFAGELAPLGCKKSPYRFLLAAAPSSRP